jgi:hypothetical protein
MWKGPLTHSASTPPTPKNSFLHLPGEIRNLVYQQVDATTFVDLPPGTFWPSTITSPDDLRATCKQVKAETSRRDFTSTTYVFRSFRVLFNYIHCYVDCFNTIETVVINLSVSEARRVPNKIIHVIPRLCSPQKVSSVVFRSIGVFDTEQTERITARYPKVSFERQQ